MSASPQAIGFSSVLYQEEWWNVHESWWNMKHALLLRDLETAAEYIWPFSSPGRQDDFLRVSWRTRQASVIVSLGCFSFPYFHSISADVGSPGENCRDHLDIRQLMVSPVPGDLLREADGECRQSPVLPTPPSFPLTLQSTKPKNLESHSGSQTSTTLKNQEFSAPISQTFKRLALSKMPTHSSTADSLTTLMCLMC